MTEQEKQNPQDLSQQDAQQTMASVDEMGNPVQEAAPTETLSLEETSQETTPSKKGYQNRTARLLNGVFIASLIVTIGLLVFPFAFSVYSYRMQGAPMGLTLIYSLVGVSTPILFCFVPFLFKFFAEVTELLDKNKD